jgi:hypothetical protein
MPIGKFMGRDLVWEVWRILIATLYKTTGN